MHRQFKKILISFIYSCLLAKSVYGEVSCQKGYSYYHKCDPYYNINLTEAKISPSKHNNNKKSINIVNSVVSINNKKLIKTHKKNINQKDLTYLNSPRQKYTEQLNSEMGLQALIDRSNYSVFKKSDIKNREQKKVKREYENNISKDLKKEIKKRVKTVKKKNIKTASKKSKLVDYNTVKSTDNLTKISKKSDIKKELTFKGNRVTKITTNATIEIDQELNLSIDEKVTKITEISKTLDKNKNSPKEQSIDTNIYVVKKGDSLLAISKKFNISINRLKKYNNINKNNKIIVGQKLLIKDKRASLNSKSYDIENTKIKKALSLKYKRKIQVTATAYTSHIDQTDETPFLAAWNNRIKPGMKIIAVSPDLIKKYGLTNGAKVKILGLPGHYIVRDKMNKRLKNHIDIYMGINKKKALNWGRKRIVLYW